MSQETPSSLFDILSPTPIATAIIRVYADYERDGLKPGSQKYERNCSYRDAMFNSVISVWSEITGEEDYLFPLSIDAVVDLWVGWRKETNGSKAAWRLLLDAKHGNEVILP